MERPMYHPFIFAVCGLVLCVMFAGNLMKAEQPMYEVSVVSQDKAVQKFHRL